MATKEVLRIKTPRVFVPLLKPARFKGVRGGRGSGKSHFFAERLVAEAIAGHIRAACLREVQNSIKDSVKQLLEDKINGFGVADLFSCTENEIRGPNDSLFVFKGLRNHTVASIKSLEGFNRAWVEEAQTISQKSLEILTPTLRAPDAEIRFSWNPERKQDPVEVFFAENADDPNFVLVHANWSDNPWFPPGLRIDMERDKANDPDKYEHVWEGQYRRVTGGAYFARQLAEARQQGRITRVSPDPLMHFRAFWDLGVSDHTAIWIAQFVGRQVFCVDYCEAKGQPLAYYVNWLKDNEYGPSRCLQILPHDGARRDGFTAVKFEDHLRAAGFTVQTVPNQGRGAAMQRVEAARRLFPAISFDETRCGAGLEALGAYHERTDERRMVGLGPEHDWASHAADAFGLMCIAHRYPDVVGDDDDDEDDRPRGRRSSTGY
jgi:phage terminase large subunit